MSNNQLPITTVLPPMPPDPTSSVYTVNPEPAQSGFSPEQLVDAANRLAGMTNVDVLYLDKYVKELEERQQPLFEAPAFAWGEFFTADGGKLSAGVRSFSIKDAFDTFMDGVVYASATHGIALNHVTVAPSGPSHAAQPTTTVAPVVSVSATNAPSYQTVSPVQQHVVPVAPATRGMGTPPTQTPRVPDGQTKSLLCVYVEVEIRPDKRTMVKFFGNTRKQPHDQYAEISAVLQPAQFVVMFSPVGPWNEQHFTTPGQFTINPAINVLWKDSETNRDRNGNPYKNIVALAPSGVSQP